MMNLTGLYIIVWGCVTLRVVPPPDHLDRISLFFLHVNKYSTNKIHITKGTEKSSQPWMHISISLVEWVFQWRWRQYGEPPTCHTHLASQRIVCILTVVKLGYFRKNMSLSKPLPTVLLLSPTEDNGVISSKTNLTKVTHKVPFRIAAENLGAFLFALDKFVLKKPGTFHRWTKKTSLAVRIRLTLFQGHYIQSITINSISVSVSNSGIQKRCYWILNRKFH